jgi:hypothetical protein
MGWGLVDSRIQDAEEYSTAASQERKAASDALEAELAKPEPDYDEVESLNLQITELDADIGLADAWSEYYQDVRDQTPSCTESPPCGTDSEGDTIPLGPDMPEEPPFNPEPDTPPADEGPQYV